jgi:hypothetical protein
MLANAAVVRYPSTRHPQGIIPRRSGQRRGGAGPAVWVTLGQDYDKWLALGLIRLLRRVLLGLCPKPRSLAHGWETRRQGDKERRLRRGIVRRYKAIFGFHTGWYPRMSLCPLLINRCGRHRADELLASRRKMGHPKCRECRRMSHFFRRDKCDISGLIFWLIISREPLISGRRRGSSRP